MSSTAGPTSYVDVPTPATQAGDLLLAVVVATDRSDPITAMDSGWTAVGGQVTSAPDNLAAVFWRIATASPPANYGFSWNDVSDRGAAVLASYSGVDTIAPIAAISNAKGTSSTSVAAPAQNPARSPTRLVVATTVNSTAVLTGPAGMTAHGDIVATNSEARLSTWDELRASPGSTGTRTTTWIGNNDYITFSIIIQGPASGTSDPTVTLNWTPPTNTWVTDYDVLRGAPTIRVAGRVTSTWTDTGTTASSGYTYTLKSIAGSWASSGISVNVAACP
ncbi:hypothetical protein [Actinoplanes solisilvae]|uniref:hypothetical protein n=1 Tax=Actinoplanes solisilvae TaxID=2486853 RepID=UPI000FD70E76|nr:hypothetical protein [Actinoplanes solisilvae]